MMYGYNTLDRIFSLIYNNVLRLNCFAFPKCCNKFIRFWHFFRHLKPPYYQNPYWQLFNSYLLCTTWWNSAAIFYKYDNSRFRVQLTFTYRMFSNKMELSCIVAWKASQSVQVLFSVHVTNTLLHKLGANHYMPSIPKHCHHHDRYFRVSDDQIDRIGLHRQRSDDAVVILCCTAVVLVRTHTRA